MKLIPCFRHSISYAGFSFALYLGLSLIVTHPIIFNLGKYVLGDSSHPGLQGEFALAHAIINSSLGKFSICSYFNYPFGQDIRQISSTSLHLYIYILLTKIFTQIQSYNILIILILALNALSMYFLSSYLTKDKSIAFIIGVFFSFSSYPFFKLSMGFVQKAIMFWIPLYLLYLFRTFEKGYKKKFGSAFLFLFFNLMLITYPPYALMVLIFTSFYLIYKSYNKCEMRDIIKILSIIICFVLITFLFNRFLKIAPFMNIPMQSRGVSNLNRIFRFYPFEGLGEGYPDNIPVGISVLVSILSGIALFRLRGLPRFISLAGVIYILFSLGPLLTIDGKAIKFLGHDIFLPYYLLLKYIPFAYRIHFPIRFFPYINLCLAISAGYGLGVIIRKIKIKKPFLISCIFFIYLFEFYQLYRELFPMKMSEIELPEFYKRLKIDEDKFAILMLPLNIQNKNFYPFMGALSERKIVNPLYREPDLYIPQKSDDLAAKVEFINILSNNGIKYIVIHMKFLEKYEMEKFEWLDDYCSDRTFYDKDAILVYEIAQEMKTYIVPDNYKSIQEAINAIDGKAKIIVRPGYYIETIDFLGKPVYLKSSKGAQTTIIDGGFGGTVVKFIVGEDRDSGIEGFTIKNGSGFVDPEYLKKNQGGGIYCRGSGPVIKNNIIINNRAENGGGILCHDCSVKRPLISSNLIKDNVAVKGGGIRCSDASPIIVNNIIRDNKAKRLGGGVYWRGSSSPLFFNNTIIDNTAGEFGGGIFGSNFNALEYPVTISNSILWGNRAYRGSQIALNLAGTKLAISSSVIQGDKEEIFLMKEGIILHYLSNNISTNPSLSNQETGGLQAGSPCIDKGNNESLTNMGIETDFGNNLRIIDGDRDGNPIVDIGAFEFVDSGKPRRGP